jgi:hypothetical protein
MCKERTSEKMLAPNSTSDARPNLRSIRLIRPGSRRSPKSLFGTLRTNRLCFRVFAIEVLSMPPRSGKWVHLSSHNLQYHRVTTRRSPGSSTRGADSSCFHAIFRQILAARRRNGRVLFPPLRPHRQHRLRHTARIDRPPLHLEAAAVAEQPTPRSVVHDHLDAKALVLVVIPFADIRDT